MNLIKEISDILTELSNMEDFYINNNNYWDEVVCLACRTRADQVNGNYHPVEHPIDCIKIRAAKLLCEGL